MWRMYKMAGEFGSGDNSYTLYEEFMAKSNKDAYILMYRRQPGAKNVYMVASW